MTTEGGVIVYGLGEDHNKRRRMYVAPFEALPAPQSASTRIVQTPGSMEVPFHRDSAALHRRRFGHRYLVVVVPQSARAPHQVVVQR